MHLDSKGLEADSGVERVFFHIRAAVGQRLGVDDLVMLAEAQIDDPLTAARGRGHKAGRGEHIVADVLDLPQHRVAAAKTVDRAVKTVDAAGDASGVVHALSSFNVLSD